MKKETREAILYMIGGTFSATAAYGLIIVGSIFLG